MIGSNVPAKGGLCNAIKVGADINCDCIQVYTANSRRWEPEPLTIEKINTITTVAKKLQILLIAHAPFLVNLASPNHVLRQKSIQRMQLEINNASSLGIKTLVLHPGNYKENHSEGIKRVVEAIQILHHNLIKSNVYLSLETMSGQGTQIGSNFEELKKIILSIKDNRNIGVCFDTCHVFSAGYDISTKTGLDKVFAQFDNIVGINKINVFHINNTNMMLGSKKDIHSGINNGNISLNVFKDIVTDIRFKEIPKILEPNKNDSSFPEQVKLLKQFYNGDQI